MDCTGVAGHLVAYHLGLLADTEADLVEAHLVGCRACLVTYLAIKRAADRAPAESPRPDVKAKLRAEVARSFPAPSERAAQGALGDERAPVPSAPARGAPRPLAVLVRRIPLYQGVALAALAASIALVAPNVARRFSHPDAAGVSLVDTARTHAESLHIY